MIYRPLVEAAGGTLMASVVFVSSASQVVGEVLGPETPVHVGLVVNLGLLAAAVYLLFQAGGTFRGWVDAVKGALELTTQVRALEARIEEAKNEREGLRAQVLEAENERSRLQARIADAERVLEDMKRRNGGHRNGGTA